MFLTLDDPEDDLEDMESSDGQGSHEGPLRNSMEIVLKHLLK